MIFFFFYNKCWLFLVTATTVSVHAKAQITDKQMLSDEHIVRASLMLATQFNTKVDGFCAPIGVMYGKRIDNLNYYPHRTKTNVPWVQILNTGQHHWVTAIFQQGNYFYKRLRYVTHFTLLFCICGMCRFIGKNHGQYAISGNIWSYQNTSGHDHAFKRKNYYWQTTL